MLRSTILKETLLSSIVSRASQTSKVEKNRNFLGWICNCLGWQIQVQCHVATSGGRFVAELEEPSAKGGNGRVGCERHFRFQFFVVSDEMDCEEGKKKELVTF
jgi:hypothetical protein